MASNRGCRVFRSMPGLSLVGSVSGADAPDSCGQTARDAVLRDLNRSGCSGIDISLAFIKRSTKPAAFRICTGAFPASRALEASARGFVTKNEEPGAELATVDAVTRGRLYPGRRLAEKPVRATSGSSASAPRVGGWKVRLLDLPNDGHGLPESGAAPEAGYRTGPHLQRIRGANAGCARRVRPAALRWRDAVPVGGLLTGRLQKVQGPVHCPQGGAGSIPSDNRIGAAKERSRRATAGKHP